ncbi:MAG TPA: AAA family ATPase [Pyrinomonadaceae bacterium]|jgi:hypothetical protein
MKLVVIFGPPAVGKMTVGFELAKLTGLKLFHNHMTIDLVLNFFEFGTPPFSRLLNEFRRRIFEEVAKSDLPGLIFTYVWGLNLESEREYIENLCDIFRARHARIFFVELEADLDERLRRNEHEFRLLNKPSKRDLEFSRANLLNLEENYQLNTDDEFYYTENYVKINNTNLSANEAARKIVEKFGFSIDNL